MRALLGALLWLCATLVLTRPAGAQIERVRLSYRAPTSCPGETAFVAEVSRRVGEPWLAGPSELARTLSVTLATRGAQSQGELEYVSSSGRRTRRAVAADACADVFSAMVLISVLAIQSGFEAEPEEEDPGAPPRPPATVVASRPDPSLRVEPTAPRRWPGATLATRAGVRFVAAGGVGPEPALGLSSFLEIGPGAASWAVRAGVAGLTTGTVGTPGSRRAAFRLQYAELGFCAELAGERISLLGCGLGQLGVLAAHGELTPPRVASVEEARVPWLALALEPRLELRTGALTWHVAPALVVPLVAEDFRFQQPDVSAHQVPRVTWSAGAGLGLHFP